MADKGSKIILDVFKILENRIVKLEKELKAQQDLVKKLVFCIAELSLLVKKFPDKQIRKTMAFKYPFPSSEAKLEISAIECDDPRPKLMALGIDLDEISELAFSENDEFSISFDTAEFIENLKLP